MASESRSSAAEVANLGWVRPPLVYLGAIASGLVAHALLPAALVPTPLPRAVGTGVILAAVALFALSVRAFRAADTPVPGNRPTRAIVRTGPYRFSRNPIYLAMSLLQLGIALLVNSIWVALTLLAAVAVMTFVVIPREERYLEARFPGTYLAYKREARRWL